MGAYLTSTEYLSTIVAATDQYSQTIASQQSYEYVEPQLHTLHIYIYCVNRKKRDKVASQRYVILRIH